MILIDESFTKNFIKFFLKYSEKCKDYKSYAYNNITNEKKKIKNIYKEKLKP